MGELLEMDDFHTVLAEGIKHFKETLKLAVQAIDYEADCPCVHALDSVPLDRSHRADTGGW